ncbi:ABC transporter substrate-binding protein [Pseudonocardia sp. N23]|uniref:ABC transporter substrate-binding protein n=1 Tax=Pseudonocardia sp. N23 TaxID=1987376 RepID=UPI000BFD2255|nr:ABC transporter substrate-binding protein [Pseudonocardia sp. N23]GAY07148.1 dipeptide-binding ABC transporter, periplasmic substrate-binding component [Pseudonocardia sp. N23]
MQVRAGGRWRQARWAGVVAAAVTMLLVVTGCGSAGGSSGAQTGPITAVDPYGGDLAKEGTPKKGGTLILGADRESVTFDPTVQNTNMAQNAVFDSLLKLSADGKVEPFIATGMATSDNGTTWTMTLTPNVRFSDGTAYDANAVIVNTQRHIDKATSPAHTYAAMIASMQAVDPLTVRFTLKSPLASFPIVFAQSGFNGTLGMIISPAALQQWGKDIGTHPVGAGPFTLTSWVRDSKMTLARNPDYWQQGMPYLDGLEFRPLPDTETRTSSTQNGDIDLAFAAYNQELVRGLNNSNLQVYYGPGNSGEYLFFNFTKAPFDDRSMREAIIRALDMNALSASQYNNRLTTATSLFDRSSPYHDQAASDLWPTFDQAKAKELVAAYRAKGGNPDFTFKTTTSRQPFAEFVQAQMAAIGIKVDVKTYDLAQYSSAVVQSGDFQLSTTVAPLDNPFPGAQRLVGTGGSGNFGKYSNPDVDKWLADAAVTSDDAQRTKDYQQVEDQVNKDLAVVWISRAYLATITKKDVKGIDRYLSRDMFYGTTWLDR